MGRQEGSCSVEKSSSLFFFFLCMQRNLTVWGKVLRVTSLCFVNLFNPGTAVLQPGTVLVYISGILSYVGGIWLF